MRKDHYPFVKVLKQLSHMLNLDEKRVLRRAGMPLDAASVEDKGVSAQQFFDLWVALEAEVDRPDLALHLGQALARTGFNSALLAFSCSPNTEIGISRLAVFKPLIGPFCLSLTKDATSVTIAARALLPGLVMPTGLAAFEMVHLLEMIRAHTAEHVIPISVGLPIEIVNREALDQFFGVPSHVADGPVLRLTIADAQRPLISENQELWAVYEPDLSRQLAEKQSSKKITIRVRSTLIELLPSGQSSIEAVCDRLHMSKRSLQRHLRAEGGSYQETLVSTRSELSMHYLKNDDMTVEEISYLLAYQDPNSFYRAFHGWTGMTPMQARDAAP